MILVLSPFGTGFLQKYFKMSDLSVNLQVENELPSVSPLPRDCDSIFGLSTISFDSPYPLDMYEDKRKSKAPPASFYERLRYLRDSDRVFVKCATKPIIRYLDQKCQFEVYDDQGRDIFFALDTTDAWASGIFEDGSKPFNVMILDYDYCEVLKVSGPGVTRLHGHAWVKHCGKDIGRIVQDDHVCSFSPTYNLLGINGNLGLRVKGPVNAYATGMPDDPVFEVFLPDEVSLMGRINKQWILFGKGNEDSEPEEAYIVTFHQNMDLKSKCLLLSLVFMLDYQFYHKKVQNAISRRCWATFIFVFFSLCVIIFMLINELKKNKVSVTVGMVGDDFYNNFTTTTPSPSTTLDADWVLEGG